VWQKASRNLSLARLLIGKRSGGKIDEFSTCSCGTDQLFFEEQTAQLKAESLLSQKLLSYFYSDLPLPAKMHAESPFLSGRI
jgi:hypothetical protein